jgi:hypothetical protein
MKLLPALLLCGLGIGGIVGCAHDTPRPTSPMNRYDPNTEFAVEDRPDGFSLTIAIARYQFVPRTGAMWAECKSAIMVIAHDVASAGHT